MPFKLDFFHEKSSFPREHFFPELGNLNNNQVSGPMHELQRGKKKFMHNQKSKCMIETFLSH